MEPSAVPKLAAPPSSGGLRCGRAESGLGRADRVALAVVPSDAPDRVRRRHGEVDPRGKQDVGLHLLADARVGVADPGALDNHVEDLADLRRRGVVVQDAGDQARGRLDVGIAVDHALAVAAPVEPDGPVVAGDGRGGGLGDGDHADGGEGERGKGGGRTEEGRLHDGSWTVGGRGRRGCTKPLKERSIEAEARPVAAAVRQIGPMADGEPMFRALGPLEVRVGGRPVDLGPAKQRALLGVLLALAPDAVPVERLVDELWPDGGPGQPLRSLQVYVSALRRALGPEGRRLTTVGRAYRLEVPDGGFDVDVFEDGITTSQEQHRAGEHEAAVATADAALALWRGRAWQDLRDVPVIEPDAARLEELRLDLRATRAAVTARAGAAPRPGARAGGPGATAPAPRGPARTPDARPAPVRPPGRGTGGVRRRAGVPGRGDRSRPGSRSARAARGDPRRRPGPAARGRRAAGSPTPPRAGDRA